MNMKKKVAWSAAFTASLLPMLLYQYGGARGVQEISGLINLCNPIAVASVLLFFIGVWVPFRGCTVCNVLSGIGVCGVVAAELYTFLTWHIRTITGKIGFWISVRLAFPEFYIGLTVSLCMAAVYLIFGRKKAEDIRTPEK